MEAFEAGEGDYRAALIEDSETLISERDSDLKFLSPLLTLKLKAKAGYTEKADQVVTVQGNVTHSHSMSLPEQVEPQDMAGYAAREMERAKSLAREKLEARQNAVEVKVVR